MSAKPQTQPQQQLRVGATVAAALDIDGLASAIWKCETAAISDQLFAGGLIVTDASRIPRNCHEDIYPAGWPAYPD
jgi:hypothetical protein